MSSPSAATFVTPRDGTLALRSTRSASRQKAVRRGDPLLVVERLPDGFVELDWQGERWFALAGALEAWRGGAAASTPPPPAFAAPPQPGGAGFAPRPSYDAPPRAAAPHYGEQPAATPRVTSPRPPTLTMGAYPVPLLPIGMAICAVLAIVASFAPWASVFGIVHVTGIDGGDGWITLGLALGAAVVAVVRIVQPQFRPWLAALALMAFLGVAGVGGYDWFNLNRLVKEAFGLVSVGWGLIAVTVAGGIGAAVSLIHLIQASAVGTSRR